MAVQFIPVLSRDAGAKDAIIFMRNLTKAIGPGFHPDSLAADYIDIETDAALFSQDEARRIDTDLDRSMMLLGLFGLDPYSIAAKVQRRQLGMPYPSVAYLNHR